MTHSSAGVESTAASDQASPATTSPATVPDGNVPTDAAVAITETAAATSQTADGEPVMIEETSMLDALRNVIDPELMINIVDLGLVYAIRQPEHGVVNVDMTLTSPACPAGPQIVSQSKISLEKIPGMKTVEIKLVMSPPWSPDRMTDEARDQLGIF